MTVAPVSEFAACAGLYVYWRDKVLMKSGKKRGYLLLVAERSLAMCRRQCSVNRAKIASNGLTN